MHRARMWPDFRQEHVLFEDEDIIVVHKPAGVPSQAAEPERPDDLVLRVRSFLAAREGKEPSRVYLGVHQRLDRDTSGLVLFTKRPEANPAIAAQLEKRQLKKRYVAGVVGWPERRRAATLDDELVKGDEGRMQVAAPRRGAQRGRGGRDAARGGGGPGRAPGQRAITEVTLRSRRGERALLDLVLQTGRTHQARVQLAHAGAPIAGDVLYRGSLAPRLMLHAVALELTHPRTNERLAIRDDLARADFEAWLERGDAGYGVYDDRSALDRALALAVERRWALGHSADRDPPERRTTAFRLVNEEGDALPGLAVDVYGEHLVAQIYVSEEWEKPGRRERLLDALDALGFDGVYLKLRPKQANVLVDTRRDDLAPSAPVRGTAAPGELVVYEEGAPFAVRLGDGLSTGIFLDQRLNRRAVRESARGAVVANLFSYTCAFSVVAALGGARRTVSVDASLAALERGRAGFKLAGLELGRDHTFAGEDAFTWLAKAAKRDERFDLVIVDPPSYSSTKKRRFVAESDYDELVALAAAVVAPGGRILACCNHRGMARQKLRRLVHEGARAAGREAVQLKDLPDAPDFPGAGGREPHMKSLLLTLR
ncbi:MAG: class I SAM-dependent methyltransferase [Labilithrix sp.]|nr:class I SAM-dependent methyltransferase [Labilithrix sp.]